jgi:hypothetical protein
MRIIIEIMELLEIASTKKPIWNPPKLCFSYHTIVRGNCDKKPKGAFEITGLQIPASRGIM